MITDQKTISLVARRFLSPVLWMPTHSTGEQGRQYLCVQSYPYSARIMDAETFDSLGMETLFFKLSILPLLTSIMDADTFDRLAKQQRRYL
jgi:hypothetical protein